MKPRHLPVVALLLLTYLDGALHAAPIFVAEENAGIAINQTDVLVYPPQMLYSAVYSGETHIVISVDATGRLTDSLVVSYTRQEFADAALSALKRWTFEPARVHGRECAGRADVLFVFQDKGVIVQTFPGSVDQSAAHPDSQHRNVYVTYALRDLDRIPTPLRVVPPVPPQGNLPHGTKRTVTVGFYIDQEGHVRMPAIEREDADDAYAAAAVAAVEQWQFEPPLRRGEPVLVLAKQDFTFVPKP